MKPLNHFRSQAQMICCYRLKEMKVEWSFFVLFFNWHGHHRWKCFLSNWTISLENNQHTIIKICWSNNCYWSGHDRELAKCCPQNQATFFQLFLQRLYDASCVACCQTFIISRECKRNQAEPSLTWWTKSALETHSSIIALCDSFRDAMLRRVWILREELLI